MAQFLVQPLRSGAVLAHGGVTRGLLAISQPHPSFLALRQSRLRAVREANADRPYRVLLMRKLLTLALTITSLAAGAGNIYRWVDAKGQVHYGETAPIGADAKGQSKVTPGATSAALAATAEAAGSSVAPAAPAEDAAKAKADREAKTANCKSAKEQIEFLETNTARRIQVPQKDGSTSRMTDEEFDKQLAEAKKQAAKNC